MLSIYAIHLVFMYCCLRGLHSLVAFIALTPAVILVGSFHTFNCSSRAIHFISQDPHPFPAAVRRQLSDLNDFLSSLPFSSFFSLSFFLPMIMNKDLK